MVFGTLAEISNNVIDFIETTMEYGVEHLGRTMTATTVDAVRMALRRRCMTQLAMATWNGYANQMLDMTKYVGTWKMGSNKAQIRQELKDMADEG